MLINSPEEGALQIAKTRCDAGLFVDDPEIVNGDELVLGAPGGGMGVFTEAVMLRAMAKNGLGPELFKRTIGFSGGAIALGGFIAGQHEISPEAFRELAAGDFVDRSVLWSRNDKERPVINLSLLDQILREGEYKLDVEAVCASPTELLFPTARPDFTTVMRSTKGREPIEPDKLVSALIRGATMPVLGPDAQSDDSGVREIDGGTWNSNIVRLWNEAADQANQTEGEARRTHLLVLDNTRHGVRPLNLVATPWVGRWIREQSDKGVSALEACQKFFGGQTKHMLGVLNAYVTGNIATNAASVQVIRPKGNTIGPACTDLEKFDFAEKTAEATMQHAIDNPETVRTYRPAPPRPGIAEAVIGQAVAGWHAAAARVRGQPQEAPMAS